MRLEQKMKYVVVESEREWEGGNDCQIEETEFIENFGPSKR